jgi:hypothetical protein
VVHFGDQQVFPGATNYVCLLFLANAGADACGVVRVDDLAEWLRTFRGTEGMFDASAVGSAEWNFTVGKGAGLFEKLQRSPEKLGDVARIWQGMVTGADRVFVVEARGTLDASLVCVADAEGREHRIEQGILKRFIKDVSLAPYLSPTSNHYLVFPYEMNGGKPVLISHKQLEAECPRAWAYLLEYRSDLAGRESGAWNHDHWYAFARNQNLAQMEGDKLVVQVISQTPRFAFDSADLYFTGGGNGPYYGVRWLNPHEARSLHYLQAILNSHISNYFIRQVSTTFRGGYWSFGKRFIEQIPIAPATPVQQSYVVKLVKYLLWLNQYFEGSSESRTARDPLMLGWWEQVLNGLVYELFFAEELYARGLRLFDLVAGAGLPDLDALPKSERPSRLRAEFERTYATGHPLRGAFSTLRSLETIRVIEGEQ